MRVDESQRVIALASILAEANPNQPIEMRIAALEAAAGILRAELYRQLSVAGATVAMDKIRGGR